MTETLKLLDVRPTLRAGGEPFAEIMQAVTSLADAQGLRLIVTFKPAPLFAVLGKRGYAHSERELENGDWEVTFTPEVGTRPPAYDTLPTDAPKAPPANRDATDVTRWPAPIRKLDNRGMMPPEPMVLTLETLEGMAEGDVLEILNDRDPLLLYPELAVRGHLAHRKEKTPEGYGVLIRKGAPQGAGV